MSFEWRTDEDEGWADEAKPKKTAASQPFLRRRWRFLLVGLVGLAAVWLAVQWQINQRVEAAAAEIEAELLATHNFVLQTAVNRDGELFHPNLSGRDPGWEEVQKTLLKEGLLLDRPMFGWQHQPAAQRLTHEEVAFTITPDLRAVELLYPQEYAITRPDGVTETVTLQQTAVYRQGNTRWLYAPPLEDFWGGWATREEGSLTLAFPQRDQAVAARLAVDLAALLDQMCAELADLRCAADFRVHLRLATSPEYLVKVNETDAALGLGLQLELPTPTLVGLPTDEASYDVLVRAYGAKLATSVLSHITGYEWRRQLFFRALRDYQLAQLGLQAWPLDEEAMYARVLSGGFDGNAVNHWTRRWHNVPPQSLQVWVVKDLDPIWQQVYMLVEYVIGQETAVSPTEMMRLINRNSYHGWMNDVLQGNYDQAIFPSQFLQYIFEQSQGDRHAEPPIPLPEGEITAVCTPSRSGSSHVYAYDLASQVWREKLTNLELSFGEHLRTEDGIHFILAETRFEEPYLSFSYYFVTEENITLLEETAVNIRENHFINYTFVRFAAETKLLRVESRENEISYSIRSLDCPAAGCPEVQATGYASFSLNGEYFIESMDIRQEEDEIQLRGWKYYETNLVSLDGVVRRPLGHTTFIYWLAEDQYGSAEAAPDGWVFTTATVSNPERQPLFYESDLLAELEDPAALTIRNVFARPNSRQLIVEAQKAWADSRQENLTYLFRLWLSEDLTSVAQVERLWIGHGASVVGTSPDGRYLVLADYNFVSNSPETAYFLLDLDTAAASETILSRGWYSLPWSADGQWFLQATRNYLLLHAPAYGYQQFIPFGLGECNQFVLSPAE